MKSISAPAMAAIEAGEAIVTGAVEILASNGIPQVSEGSEVTVSWWQNTFVQTSGNDEACMGIGFLDSSGTLIGSPTFAAYTQPTSWTQRSHSATAPAGAESVRVFMDMNKVVGSNNDGYIDDIELVIDGVSVSLTNSGAETGTAVGWTNSIGGVGVRHTSATPAAHSGSYYFSGGTSDHSRAYQDVVYEDQSVRVWGGYGEIELNGKTYTGIGDRGLAQQTAGAVGGFAQGLILSLSGVEPQVIDLLDADEIKGASVVIRRLIFASDGKTLLDESVFDRGRVDTVETAETIGGAAEIRVAVETAARGLGRSGARQRADSDQRLINPNDGYFKNTAYAGEKLLYWGGRKPYRSGSTSGGSVSSSEFLASMTAYRSTVG